MSAYGYGPPPPPPPPAGAGGHSSHGRSNTSYQGGRGGGGSSGHRGGGGHRGRGGHHNNSNNHRGDYRAPSAQPSHYDYAAAQAYTQHGPPAYGAAHVPAGYPQAQPHWAPEHAHAHAQAPPPHPHAHGAVPMNTPGYHPYAAAQAYPPQQYPATVPPYTSSSQYPHAYQPQPQQNPAQWDGQGASVQAPYGPARARGSYADRGGAKGTPVRQGFEHQAPPPVANGAYGHSFAPEHHLHHPPPQYPYAGPPPPPGPAHQDSYYVQQPRRGRGGHHNGSTRGRGGHNNHHYGNNDRSRPNKHGPGNHHKNHNNAATNPNNNGHNQQQKNDKQAQHHAPPAADAKKKKRKVNTLGLTPAMDSESEDDEGEEKVLSEMIGKESLAVKDVAAFLAERKKNFPTKARVEARKAAELAQTKEVEAEQLEKRAKLLRRQLAKVEVSIKRKREQGDEGDDMRAASATEEESSDSEPPEVMSSTSKAPQPAATGGDPDKKADISRHCKYYSTGGTCGKKGKCRFVHDPEVREAAIKEREANNGRLTIQQRLILNDKEQEDLTVLQSIQYLRAKGLMPNVPAPKAGEEAQAAAQAKSSEPSSKAKPSSSTTQAKNDDSSKRPKPAPATTSLLPAASPSLPLPPHKRDGGAHRSQPPPSIIPNANSTSDQGLRHYQGWLLQPYGSSNASQAKGDNQQ